MKLNIKIAGALALVSVLPTTAHAQDYQFNGSVSSDPTLDSNYNGATAPTFGAPVTGSLDVNNSGANAFIYSSAQGTTVFSSYLDVGVFQGAGSAFQMTGGNLTFNSDSFPSAVGFGGTNSMSVSGGTLNFTGAFTGGGGPDSLWLTNDGNGTFNLSGGTVNVAQELAFSRNGGTALLNITGGVFDVQGVTGTLYNGNGGEGNATLQLGLGSGLFEETASDDLNLGGNFKLNFALGSGGQLSLFSVDDGVTAASALTTDVTSGDVQIGGITQTALADYSITTSGDQAFLQLASPAEVPEPGTWAMLISGYVLLFVVRRFRRINET